MENDKRVKVDSLQCLCPPHLELFQWIFFLFSGFHIIILEPARANIP